MRVKSIDLQAMPAGEAAAHVLAELAASDGLVEVGYRDGERVQLGVVAAPLAERRFGADARRAAACCSSPAAPAASPHTSR